MEKWQGKTAVVTGASAGIGAAIVKDFAKAGINVIGLARRPEKIVAVALELGETPGKVFARQCDVSDRESIKEAFKWIEDKFKVVHILVNNAGIGRKTQILTDDLDNGDNLDEVIKTNFNGLVHVTRHAYQLMKSSDDYGMIVNINSIVGHSTPFPKDGVSNANVYHGTKYAVTATTEVLVVVLVSKCGTCVEVCF
jgi:NADP+-dependent farnesol dehydrogenase